MRHSGVEGTGHTYGSHICLCNVAFSCSDRRTVQAQSFLPLLSGSENQTTSAGVGPRKAGERDLLSSTCFCTFAAGTVSQGKSR